MPNGFHQRALDRFSVDLKSSFYHKIKQYNLPFAAGISGRTGSLLLGALLYGQLSREELQQYALGICGFLIGGGNHSFHEIMVVARHIGIVAYRDGDYISAIPEHLFNSQPFLELSRDFSQFMTKTSYLRSNL